MNKLLRFIILGIVLIILIDSIGSVTSRILDFNYGYFSILSVLNYGLIGYLTSKYYNLSKALLAGAVLGLFDATIGWQLAIFLKANGEGLEQEVGSSLWIASVLFAIGFAVFVAMIGGWIYKKTISKEALPTTLR